MSNGEPETPPNTILPQLLELLKADQNLLERVEFAAARSAYFAPLLRWLLNQLTQTACDPQFTDPIPATFPNIQLRKVKPSPIGPGQSGWFEGITGKIATGQVVTGAVARIFRREDGVIPDTPPTNMQLLTPASRINGENFYFQQIPGALVGDNNFVTIYVRSASSLPDAWGRVTQQIKGTP